MARGHVRQRGKGWVYVIRHETLERAEWSRQQPTRADAEKLMTARLAELDKGLGIGVQKDTLEGYLTAWLAGRQRVKPRTRLAYRWVIEHHIVPYLGDVLLVKLRPADVSAWHGALRAGGVSDRAIAYAHQVLSMALRQAVRWEHLARNVCELVEQPRIVAREYQWWEPDEAQAFLVKTAESDDAALWRLALSSLMRRGELLALEWRDIDWARRRLAVSRTVTASGIRGRPWMVGTPKGGRVRVIVLDEETMAALRRHQERQAFQRARSDRWSENGLVFPGRDGNLMQFETLRQRFITAVTRAGLPMIRFHDLRHTGATLLLRSGVPLPVVSERLGHASMTTTAAVYAHVSETMQEEAAEVMGRALGGD